jgi:hypothetical protein
VVFAEIYRYAADLRMGKTLVIQEQA